MVADLCLRYLKPKRLLVIRNENLAAFTTLITDSEHIPVQEARRSDGRRSALESLLELSRRSVPHLQWYMCYYKIT